MRKTILGALAAAAMLVGALIAATPPALAQQTCIVTRTMVNCGPSGPTCIRTGHIVTCY